MELEITIHAEHKFIEFVSRGVLDNESSMDMARTIAETMRHHRVTKAIIDHRNVTYVSGKVIEVYERPKLFRLLGIILGIKIAEIIKPEDLEHFKFLETVCLNSGYKFSVFYDRIKALEWLLG
jgi:hypothetical protein